jgi:hypothetical protein
MGWQNDVFNLVIIEETTGFSGLFVYSPSIAPGDLIASIAAIAGTDPEGNSYLDGITAYNRNGTDQYAVNIGTQSEAEGAYILFECISAPWFANGLIRAFLTGPGGSAEGGALTIDCPQSTSAAATTLITLYDTVAGNSLGVIAGAHMEINRPIVLSGGNNGGWTAFNPLSNGWAVAAAGPGAQVRNLPSPAQSMQLSATMTPGTTADGTTVATLPAAFRPVSTHTFPVTCDQLRVIAAGPPTTTEGARFSINSSGVMSCFGIAAAATQVSFDVIIPLAI